MAGTNVVKKYGSLRVVSAVIAALGHVVAAGIILVVVFAWQGARDVGLRIGLQFAGLIVAAIVIWLLFQAVSDVILVLLDIEENTRRTADSRES